MWLNRVFRKIVTSSSGLTTSRGQIRTIIKSTFTAAEETDVDYAEILNPIREGENTFALAHLRTLPEYRSSLFDPSPLKVTGKWKTFKPIVQKVREEAANPENPLTMDIQADFISSVIAEKSTLSDEELFAVLYALQLYKSRPFPKHESAYKHLWESLDQECVARVPGWDLNTLFTVDDLLFSLNAISLSNFHWHLVKRLFRKCDKLTKEQFIRFMFCLNVGRRIPKIISTYELEHVLLKIVDNLSPEEISIVSMGFFKTESKIRDDRVVKTLLEKVIPAASDLNKYFVSAVAKLARFCGRSGIANTLYDFQERFSHELYRLNLTECIHLALVGTNTQVKHTGLLEGLRDRVESNLDSARLKEIERALLALTMFNIDCDSLCHKIIEQLRSPSPAFQKECLEYGRCLPSILHYASIRNIVPEDLVTRVLDPEFLKTYYDKNRYKYQRELLCLDMTVDIERPDYKGNRLSSKESQFLMKHNMLYLNPMSHERVSEYESGLRSVGRHMKDILGGEDFIHFCNVLPQYHTAEILYCMDENNHPVKIPKSIRQMEEHEVKFIPKDEPTLTNATLNLILYCNRNICLFGENVLLGQPRLHCRQLEKLGYKLHYVFALEWNAYKLDEGKRRDHIYNLIYGPHSKQPESEKKMAANA